MSATDRPSTGERPDGDPAEKRSPWLWATLGVAVVAIALGIWGVNQRSNATAAKADLQAEPAQTAAPATTQQQQTTSAPSTPASSGTQTTEDDRHGVGVAALAAAATAFAAARKALNHSEDEVEQLEADVDKANAEADQAQQDADKAKAQADSAAKSASNSQKKSDTSEKQKADADEADARRRELRAKADAAASCAKAMLGIVGDIPSAASLDEGLKNAAGEIAALVPKCKDAVAAAGG